MKTRSRSSNGEHRYNGGVDSISAGSTGPTKGLFMAEALPHPFPGPHAIISSETNPSPFRSRSLLREKGLLKHG